MKIGSYRKVLDNSGARLAKCLRIIKRNHTRKGGDRIIVVIKKSFANKRVKTGDIYHAAVVQLRTTAARFHGSRIFFSQSGIVLLKRGEWTPLASRVGKSMFREVRQRGFGKLSSLALSLLLQINFY